MDLHTTARIVKVRHFNMSLPQKTLANQTLSNVTVCPAFHISTPPCSHPMRPHKGLVFDPSRRTLLLLYVVLEQLCYFGYRHVTTSTVITSQLQRPQFSSIF